MEYVGIRAHQLIFTKSEEAPSSHLSSNGDGGVSLTDSEDGTNTFPCWLATISETQHRMTLYLKLNQPANHPEDYHLQAEVFKDKWAELKNCSFPWKIQLNPLKIIVF